jgi:hypothetical protein
LDQGIQNYLNGMGVEFATVEDCVKAMLKISSDATVNGTAPVNWNFEYLLTSIGRAFGIVPRSAAPEGYMDLDHDDYKEGDVFKTWQQTVLDTALRLVVRTA